MTLNFLTLFPKVSKMVSSEIQNLTGWQLTNFAEETKIRYQC